MSVVKKILVGNTFKAFWISSGTTPSVMSMSIIDGSETIVSSGAGVSSGSGHFYRFFSVDTPGYYAVRFNATITGLPYIRKTRFKAVLGEVD